MSCSNIYIRIFCRVFRVNPRYSVLLLLHEVITTSVG
jgi:hypothetical protein